MLLAAHIGNLEICRALADLRGYIHLNILVHTKHAEKFNRLLGSVERGGANIELIQVSELNPAVAIRLQDKIERRANSWSWWVTGYRLTGGRTVRARFLGEEAEFPQGPYLLGIPAAMPGLQPAQLPRGRALPYPPGSFRAIRPRSARQPEREQMLGTWRSASPPAWRNIAG